MACQQKKNIVKGETTFYSLFFVLWATVHFKIAEVAPIVWWYINPLLTHGSQVRVLVGASYVGDTYNVG